MKKTIGVKALPVDMANGSISVNEWSIEYIGPYWGAILSLDSYKPSKSLKPVSEDKHDRNMEAFYFSTGKDSLFSDPYLFPVSHLLNMCEGGESVYIFSDKAIDKRGYLPKPVIPLISSGDSYQALVNYGEGKPVKFNAKILKKALSVVTAEDVYIDLKDISISGLYKEHTTQAVLTIQWGENNIAFVMPSVEKIS